MIPIRRARTCLDTIHLETASHVRRHTQYGWAYPTTVSEDKVALFVPVIGVLLALILAMSPQLLLSNSAIDPLITRDDLTSEQIHSLREIGFATLPSEVNEGLPAIHLIEKVDGNLIIAGTWAGEFHFKDHSVFFSEGARDVFLAKLDVFGNWSWVHTFGGSGEDSVVSLESQGSEWVLRGRFYDTFFADDHQLYSDSKWSANAFQVNIEGNSVQNLWHYDEALLPLPIEGVWCGYR